MVVAQHPGGGLVVGVAQRLAPERGEFGARRCGHEAVAMRDVPVEQKLGLDQERVDVVGRHAVLDAGRHREGCGSRLAVQRDQHIDGSRIAFLDRRRRIAFHDALGAEILQQHQPFVEVGGVDLRRREAALAQRARHRDERLHILGKVRDRAVGQAAAHRRARRAGAAHSSGCMSAPCG